MVQFVYPTSTLACNPKSFSEECLPSKATQNLSTQFTIHDTICQVSMCQDKDYVVEGNNKETKNQI